MSRREGDSVRRARVSAEHGRLCVNCRVRRWSQLVDLNLGPAVYETASHLPPAVIHRGGADNLENVPLLSSAPALACLFNDIRNNCVDV